MFNSNLPALFLFRQKKISDKDLRDSDRGGIEKASANAVNDNPMGKRGYGPTILPVDIRMTSNLPAGDRSQI